MTAKKRTRKFYWNCGATFEARLKRGDRTRLEYRQWSNGKPYDGWHSVDLGRAIAFAYGAMIPAKDGIEFWTPRGLRPASDMIGPRVEGWRATTFQVLKYLGVVTK